MSVFDLAMMTVSSSGTGTITLSAAVSGFLTFDLAGCSTAAAGQAVSYGINDTTQSEAASGTYFSSSIKLTRGSSTSGLKSTNSDSPINMSNAAQVYITPIVADYIPAGTKMLFVQTNAPTGWTKDVDQNDKAIRIVSGTASSSGSLPFSTVFGYTTTGSTTISQANLPNVSLTGTTGASSGSIQIKYNTGVFAAGVNAAITSINPGQAVTGNTTDFASLKFDISLPLGGSGTALSMPIDMRVAYVDVIKCSKS